MSSMHANNLSPEKGNLKGEGVEGLRAEVFCHLRLVCFIMVWKRKSPE